MLAKVTSINIEQDRVWLVGGDGADKAVYLMLRLSQWPNVKGGDEFVVTIQPAKDVPGWPEEKGGDDEC